VTTRIIRAARRYRYAQIDMNAIEDTRLSWAARGLLIYVLSRPDDWRVITKHLVKQGNLRRDGIHSLLKELRKCGYVRRKTIRNETGSFSGVDYYVHELGDKISPRTDLPYPAEPDPGGPDTASPDPAKPYGIPSTEVYLGTTSTTTTDIDCGGSGASAPSRHSLIFPDAILTAEREVAEKLVKGLPDALQQPVLDEWAGIIRAGAIKTSTIGCLRALVDRALDGRFTAERGLRIRHARKSQQRLKSVLEKAPDLPPPDETDVNVRRLRWIQARAARDKGDGAD
jgi:hypothetical protein